MNHPHKSRIPDLAREAIQSAATINYEWDYKAIDWPIDEFSIVWEVGSYKGRWALQICQKYNPCMFAFEPQTWAADVTQHVLQPYNARVFNYALGSQDGAFHMTHQDTDGCSFYRHGTPGELVKMRDVRKVKEELLGDKDIDLLMMNIEGYEYQLLPYMLVNGVHPKFLSVQFHGYEMIHDVKPDESYMKVRGMIEKLYVNLWDYGMTLSGWVLR